MSISPTLTIRSIAARSLDLRLTKPMETASGVMATTPVVLVDILTEEGVPGSSYLRCYTPTALRALAALTAELDGVLKGDSATPSTVAKKLERHFRLVGTQGLTGIAMAGIDMALWDARAKACGIPLVTLLGGEPKAVPAYASLRTMSPQGAAAEAEEVLRLGFTALKVKVGRSDIAADLETIRAVRAVAGKATDLMVDYNQSLSVADAIARGRLLEDEHLFWIEEPTRADDCAGHAKIAKALRTPIQLGENWWGIHDMAKSIAAGASDHAMFDAQKIGGVTGWLGAAALAEAAGLPVSSHAFPEFSLQLLAVTKTCKWLEYLDHLGPILQEPVRIEKGCAIVPDRPGAGLAWDEDVVKRFIV